LKRSTKQFTAGKLNTLRESSFPLVAIYRCGRCGKEFDDEQLRILPGIRCPYCGYSILFMVRKRTIKIVKAI
jgi:DNA-directed RNA polymerase, subunit RPC10 (contains C4-type Zn-finger)